MRASASRIACWYRCVSAETHRYQQAIRDADARIHELEGEADAFAQLRATHADTEDTLRRLRESAAAEKKKRKEEASKATERMAVLEQELFELRTSEGKLKAKLAAAAAAAAAATEASAAAAPSPSANAATAAALAQSQAALEAIHAELGSKSAALAEAQARALRAEEALAEQARAHETQIASLQHQHSSSSRRISFDSVNANGSGSGSSKSLLLSPPPAQEGGQSPIFTAAMPGVSLAPSPSSPSGGSDAPSKDAFLLAQLQARQKQFKAEFLQVLSLLESEQKKCKELLTMQRLDEARHRARVTQLEGLLGLEGIEVPEQDSEAFDAAEAREQRRRDMMAQQRAAEAEAQKRRTQQLKQQHADGSDVAIEIVDSSPEPASGLGLSLSLPERSGSELQLRGLSLRSGDDLDRAEAYSVQVLAEIQHRIAVIEARFDHVASLVQGALGAAGVDLPPATAAEAKLGRPPSPSQSSGDNGLDTVSLATPSHHSGGGNSAVSARDYATAVSKELSLLHDDFSSLLRLLQHLDAHQATESAYIHGFAERWQSQQAGVMTASKQLLLACVQPCMPFLSRHLPANVVGALSSGSGSGGTPSGRMRRIASGSELASLRTPTPVTRSNKLRTPHKGSASSEVKYAEI